VSTAAPTLPFEPARRLRRWHAWLVVWRLHRWLGLGFATLLVLLSTSGSLLVIHHELEHAFEREIHVAAAAPGATAPSLTDLTRAISPLAPDGYRLFRITPAGTADAAHRIVFRAPDAPVRWTAFVEPATGRLLWSGPEESLLTPWLLGLHMQLHAGRIGYYLTGVGGLALTLLAFTGLYIHRDRFSQLWRHPFRLSLGWRVAFADLHKWIGILTLYFPVMLGLTGALYCLSILTAATPPPPAVPFDAKRLAPLEPMFAAARARFPDAEVFRAQIPAAERGVVSVLLLHREAPVWQKFSRMEFDATTGASRTVKAASDAPFWVQFRSMLAPLHFGLYGAPWVKWAYFIGGLAPAALALSGIALWWVRRGAATRSGRPPTPARHQAHAAAPHQAAAHSQEAQ
jgi:uncharacterized iron-regulated membrane protein